MVTTGSSFGGVNVMPRQKPDNVQVHRIELGTWERERIKKAEMITTAAVLGPAVGIAALGLGVAGAGFALYQWLKTDPFEPLTDAAGDAYDKLKEAVTGPEPYASTGGVAPEIRWEPYDSSMDSTGQNLSFLELISDSLINSFVTLGGLR